MGFDPAERGGAAGAEGGLDMRRWASNERILITFWPRAAASPELLAPVG
jgi:hypothetical protein